MKNDLETKFTGWSFIAAAVLLWGGWAFSPHHLGEYIVAEDFTEVSKSVWTWIWMFRIHIFGWVTMAIALFSMSSYLSVKPYRAILFPGIGMIIVGTFVLAIGTAFYYNFGAWGVGKTIGKSPQEIQEFIDGILFTNQYVTYFIRFGRIFSGVGLVLLGTAFIKWNIIAKWLGWFTAILGFVAMAIILAIPDNFEVYKPIFHIKSLWLLVMGIYFLTKGVHVSEEQE